MRPNYLLSIVGISASGEIQHSTGNYMLSVSATSFSEISDVFHLHHIKEIVKLRVADTYYGLSKMLTNGSLVRYESNDWGQIFKSALLQVTNNTTTNSTKDKYYALIRTTTIKKYIFANIVAQRLGWKVEKYDSSENATIFDLNNLLEKQPEQNTIIFIKGMCRMGKVICKKYLAFCMETAKNPNTDVVLQGFLGRMCGYHNYDSCKLYLPNKIMDSDEFTRYVNYTLIDSIIIPDLRKIMMPRRGTNLKPGRTQHDDHLFPSLPIKIPAYFSKENKDNQLLPLKQNAEYIIDSIRALVNNNQFITKNVPEVMIQIKIILSNPGFVTKVHIVGRNGNGDIKPKSKLKLPEQINNLFLSDRAESIKEEIIWFSSDFPEHNIMRGDIFIILSTLVPSLSDTDINPYNIVTTSKKELFYINQ